MPLLAPIALILLAGDAGAGPVDFERDVRPIFERSCLECHGPRAPKNFFGLYSRERLLAGGISGPAVLPGRSGESRLVRYVSGSEEGIVMPPRGGRLTAEEVALLAAWIDQELPWPAGLRLKPDEPESPPPWYLERPVKSAPPDVKAAEWLRNAVDRFILARLEREGLSPSPEADRADLIRRLSLNLLGLPPEPEETAAFLADPAPDAYERLVERLLASPRYGERWGRHWLDAVRFAETHGFEMNQPRPSAWRYRDWVIEAFNADVPYDRFVEAQLAGDLLGEPAATGFLVAGPWDQVKSPDVVLTAQQRMDELHDMVSATGATFLGLTVGCARCHNHKFDPISQLDYYRLQAVFAGVQHGERGVEDTDLPRRRGAARALQAELAQVDARRAALEPLASAGSEAAREPGSSTSGPRPAVNSRRNVDRFAPVEARWVRFTVLKTNLYEPCIDELEVFAAGGEPRNLALASSGAKTRSSGNYSGSELHKLEHVNDGRHGNGRSWISNEPGKGWVEVELADAAAIDRVVWGRDREGKYQDRLAVEYRIEVAAEPGDWRLVASSADRASREQPAAAVGEAGALARRAEELSVEIERLLAPARAYAGVFAAPGPTHRLHRGDPLQKREEVAPGSIAVLGRPLAVDPKADDGVRRLALARWIAARENPLTARVIVNRIWLHHFGEGLVSTPSDFGAGGAGPGHRELLDYLAAELMDRGWSIKSLQRAIVLSSAYRQSSRPRAAALAVDGDARLLWRFPPRRIDAESIRDAILQASGALDLSMGGPGYEVFEPNENYVRVYEPKKEYGPAEWRRMVYQRRVRMQHDAVFGAFDCPDGGQMCPKRTRSTTPIQALGLFNSEFVACQAEVFAARLRAQASRPEDRVERAFRIVFSRAPDPDERRATVKFVEAEGLEALCRALFNSSEFLFLP